MQKKTFVTLIISFLLVFLLGLILYLFYQKENTIIFYGVIKEKNGNNYIVNPLPNEKIYNTYDVININIKETYQEGDLIIITASKEVIETYPVSMKVFSSKLFKRETNKISEEELITQLIIYSKEDLNNIIDFILHEKDIHNHKFNSLTDGNKMKVIKLTLEVDDKLVNYPNVKEELIMFYLDKTAELCQNNDPICNQLKNDFIILKNQLNITWEYITNEIGEQPYWYEIFSGE